MCFSVSGCRTTSRHSGFTRIDLLTVLAAVAVLAVVQSGAVASSGSKGSVAVCLNNLRQLTQALQMYAEDNLGMLPLNRDSGPLNWVQGVLDFSPSTENVSAYNLTNTPFGRYTMRPEIYRCPADLSSVRTREGRILPRSRSYSMNGMAGLSSGYGGNSGYRTYTNLAEMTAPPPSRLWIFLEEHPDSIGDGRFVHAISSTLSGTEMFDYPAAHHDYSMALSYADGHVEIKRWLDPRTSPLPRYSSSLLNQPQPNNPDIMWLGERTSARIE